MYAIVSQAGIKGAATCMLTLLPMHWVGYANKKRIKIPYKNLIGLVQKKIRGTGECGDEARIGWWIVQRKGWWVLQRLKINKGWWVLQRDSGGTNLN